MDSGSTIVGVGDSEPPQFIYEEDEYQDIFVSGPNFSIKFLSTLLVFMVPPCLIEHCD